MNVGFIFTFSSKMELPDIDLVQTGCGDSVRLEVIPRSEEIKPGDKQLHLPLLTVS